MSEHSKPSFGSASATGSILESDPLLGFYTSDSLMKQVYEHYKATPDKTYLICADFINLSQLNAVAERPRANAILQAVTNIYQEALNELNPTANIGFRIHGDDIAWIIEGADLTNEKVAEALKKAEAKTKTFVDKTGLSKLQHHGNKNLAGLGFTPTFVEINKFSGPLWEVRNTAAFQIAAKRRLTAKANNEAMPKEELLHEHYLRKIDAALSEIETKPVVEFLIADTAKLAAPILQDAKQKTKNLERAQSVEKAIKAAKLQHVTPQEDFIQAANSMIVAGLRSVAASWRDMDRPKLAGEIEKVAQSFDLGSQTVGSDTAYECIREVVESIAGKVAPSKVAGSAQHPPGP